MNPITKKEKLAYVFVRLLSDTRIGAFLMFRVWLIGRFYCKVFDIAFGTWLRRVNEK